jgi:hypothetical protein
MGILINLSIFLNYTRFHGELPVKIFLKMWGVISEDVTDSLQKLPHDIDISFTKRKPGKRRAAGIPDEKLHKKDAKLSKGTDVKNIT